MIINKNKIYLIIWDNQWLLIDKKNKWYKRRDTLKNN